MRVLIPVDGSETSLRAIDHIVTTRTWYTSPPDVHILNVQHPLPNDVSRFIAPEDIRGFHHDAGIGALAGARAKLDAAAMRHAFHISVGDPAHVIVHYAKDLHCDEIIMTSRGQGGAAETFGSVPRRVLHLTDRPVVLIK